MNLPYLAIRNAAFVLVLLFIALAIGVVSFLQMPRSEDPNIQLPIYNIIVVYPGTSPEDMEQLIVDPIEEVVDELDDILEIRTEIEEGLVVMTIEASYNIDGEDKFDELVRDVNTIRPELPEGIALFDIFQFVPAETNVIHQFALGSDNVPYNKLHDYAEELESTVEKIQGVRAADIKAYPEEEVRVSLDFQRLANQNIPLDQVLGVLRANNANIPGGDINAQNRTFSIQTTGGYESLQDIANTVITSANGHLVYLKDIADVRMDYEDILWKARFVQEKAVFVLLTLEEGSNILTVAEEIRAKGKAFQENLPPDVHLETAFEQAPAVAARINDFFMNLLQGVVLVGAIILIFLGWRAASVIITVIPLCVIIALALLSGVGYGLQQLSIASLVLALGLLVDNGIVVIENITRFVKEGLSPVEAAAKGAGEVGPAIISSTITTLLSFFPLTQLGAGPGEFLRSLPITVIFTLSVSLLLALTFSPLMASKIMRKRKKEKPGLVERGLKTLIEKVYRPAVRFSLKRGWAVVLIAVAALAFSVSLFPAIGVSFFPTADKPILLIDIDTPNGTSLEGTEKAVAFVEKVLDTMPYVKHYTANIGHGNPLIYYNRIPERNKKNYGQVLATFEEWEPEKFYQTLGQLRRDFDTYYNAKITFKELKNGAPVNAPVEIRILGENDDILKILTEEVEKDMRQIPGIINIQNPISVDKTQLKLRLNKEKAGLIGLSYLSFDQTVRASLTGLKVGEVSLKNDDDYPLVVRMPFDEEPGIEDLNKVYFATATGAQVPLRQVAELEFEASSAEILHFNLDKHATVYADVINADETVPLTQQLITLLDDNNLPDGYSYYIAGEYEEQQSTFGSLGVILALANIAIFAVLVLQFRSVLQPLIVFSAIPLAITGSFIGLYLSGWSFSFLAFVGLISLIGIVVNNSIILVDYINQLRQEGMEFLEAIQYGCERRFVPIIVTSVTTILGLLPLTVQGTTLWSPLGITIIGGMISSTILTLLIVPVLYKWFSRRKAFDVKAEPGE